MEIITNKITTKIKDAAKKSLNSLVVQLIKEGAKEYDVSRAVQNYTNLKIKEFYNKANEPQLFKNIIKIDIKKDSKAELSVSRILESNGIDFKFQYPIGPYKADFLLGESIVLEIDGPHHKEQQEYDSNRNKYMERMGYDVIRLPIRLFALAPDAVAEQLKEELNAISR